MACIWLWKLKMWKVENQNDSMGKKVDFIVRAMWFISLTWDISNSESTQLILVKLERRQNFL